jgi:RNA polymerase sigma-70 factor (ECF subfamily)
MILTTSDEKLVARTLAGDRRAFQTLVERHYGAVYRMCRNVLHNPQDAEDATQEVFLRVYNALGQFSGRGAFGAWLRRLTINHCLNRVQCAAAQLSARSHSIDLVAESLPASRDSDPVARLWRAEEKERIRIEMQDLPPQQRAALGLRVVDGLSYDEIAEVMGVPVNSVRSWLHRGRARLRQALEEVVEC